MRQHHYGTHIWEACYRDAAPFNCESCRVCGEPATCFPHASLVASYEGLDSHIPLCDECAEDDAIEPSEHPL